MSNPRDLYPDFKLTLENCHEEPINRPIAIQGHGHMLVFTGTDDDLQLHAMSENCAELFGLKPDSLWHESPLHILPREITELLPAAASRPKAVDHLGNWEAPSGQRFDLISHHDDDCTVLELEPVVEPVVDLQTLPRLARNKRSAQTKEQLYSLATKAIAESYDFDRVMIYRFDEDKHGHVVGEHKRDHLEPYLGLHYPETDIPKIARDAFLKVGSRFIANIHVENDALLFNPNPRPGAPSPYLDLTQSQLRAISPIHIEYLANMGVQSTLTLSIVIAGNLWGLIACHHYSPRQLRFDSRSQGEVIGALVAKRISEIDIRDEKIAEAEGRLIEADFLNKVSLAQDYRIEMLQNAPDTLKMCRADGVALVTLDDIPFSLGLVPERSVLLAARDWLVDNGHDTAFQTSEFSSTTGISSTPEKPVGGMLACCLSTISGSYLLWFRQPVAQTTFWAGDPKKSIGIETSPDTGDLSLHPRQSFAKWEVVVEGQSDRWEESALKMARRVRDEIVRKELVYTAEQVKRSNDDFMQLTYAAVHDLQEPLRTQTSFLELMEETLGESSIEEQRKNLSATKLAADRMRDLLSDILSFASVGSENRRDVVDLGKLAAELRDDLALKIEERGAIINVADLPQVMGDKHKFRQLLQNFLTNAIKYASENETPIIDIYTEEDGAFWSLCIKDNGIGIEEQYFDSIFKLFQRLHRKTEYEGTGIGLATCKKIAESMNAVISVESEVGKGSTFRVKFNKSIVQE